MGHPMLGLPGLLLGVNKEEEDESKRGIGGRAWQNEQLAGGYKNQKERGRI